MICLTRNFETWVPCCWCVTHIISLEGSLMYIHVIEHNLLSTRDQGFQELWQEALASCWLWISVTSWAPWKWKSLSGVWLFATPWLYSPWNSLSQNTRVGIPSLLQEIFPTQGLNLGLPHYRQILYQLSHKGSPLNIYWKKNWISGFITFFWVVESTLKTFCHFFTLILSGVKPFGLPLCNISRATSTFISS